MNLDRNMASASDIITKKKLCYCYFLIFMFQMQAVEISRTDYEPSDIDILYAEGITSSDTVACMEFLFPKSTRDEFVDSAYQHDPSLRSALCAYQHDPSLRSVLLHIH